MSLSFHSLPVMNKASNKKKSQHNCKIFFLLLRPGINTITRRNQSYRSAITRHFAESGSECGSECGSESDSESGSRSRIFMTKFKNLFKYEISSFFLFWGDKFWFARIRNSDEILEETDLGKLKITLACVDWALSLSASCLSELASVLRWARSWSGWATASTPSWKQRCGTVTIFYGSGSDFWKVRLRFRFWIRFLTHYGSDYGSDSGFWSASGSVSSL